MTGGYGWGGVGVKPALLVLLTCSPGPPYSPLPPPPPSPPPVPPPTPAPILRNLNYWDSVSTLAGEVGGGWRVGRAWGWRRMWRVVSFNCWL